MAFPSAPPRPTVSTDRRSGGAGHYTCGAIGLAAAAAVLVAAYSTLVALTAALPYLSTTAIVIAVAAVWGVVWLGLEIGYSQFWRFALPPC